MVAGLRSVLAAVLLTLGCVGVPASATAWWMHDTLTDTDQFVATAAPLAEDPAVQDEVVRQLVLATMDLLADLPPGLADRLRPQVARIAARVVESPAFAEAWERSLPPVHEQLLALLSGDDPDAVLSADDRGTLSLELATLTRTLRVALEDAGVPGVDRLPTVRATIPVASVDDVTALRPAYDALERWAPVLPVLTALLLVAGLVLARDRIRAGRLAAFGALALLVLTLIALTGGRQVAVDHLPTESRDAGAAVLTLLTEQLRSLLRLLAVAAFASAAVTVVAGWFVRRPGRTSPSVADRP